jgi:hypothetical protein
VGRCPQGVGPEAESSAPRTPPWSSTAALSSVAVASLAPPDHPLPHFMSSRPHLTGSSLDHRIRLIQRAGSAGVRGRAPDDRIAHARNLLLKNPPVLPLRNGGKESGGTFSCSPLAKGGYRGVDSHRPSDVRDSTGKRSRPSRPLSGIFVKRASASLASDVPNRSMNRPSRRGSRRDHTSPHDTM